PIMCGLAGLARTGTCARTIPALRALRSQFPLPAKPRPRFVRSILETFVVLPVAIHLRRVGPAALTIRLALSIVLPRSSAFRRHRHPFLFQPLRSAVVCRGMVFRAVEAT